MIATTIDTLIIVLLAGSIAYGYLISRRVNTLMRVLRELDPVIAAYSSAVDKSEDSVRMMIDELNREEPLRRSEQENGPRNPDPVRRQERERFSGIQSVTDKKELVRRFFDTRGAERV